MWILCIIVAGEIFPTRVEEYKKSPFCRPSGKLELFIFKKLHASSCRVRMLEGREERSGPPLTRFVVASRLLSLRGDFFRCVGNFFRPGENFPELGGAAVSAGDVARPPRRLESVWPMPLDGLEPPGVPGTEPGHPQNVPPARGIFGEIFPGLLGEIFPGISSICRNVSENWIQTLGHSLGGASCRARCIEQPGAARGEPPVVTEF